MRFFALATAATLALAAPVAAQDAAFDADTTLATVNGTDITLGHLIVLYNRLPEQYRNISDEELYKGMLDQLVDQTLIAQSVSGAPADDPKLARLTLENERVALLANQVVNEIADQDVPEADLQAAYDAQTADFEPAPEYNASHILVETLEEAQDLVTMLADGADFAELAKEKSTGPSGPNGGNLGWFGKGAMVPAFEEAVVGLDVGAVSEPVQTQFGFHVVKLNDSRETQPPSFDSQRANLQDIIIRERVLAEIERIRGAATVVRPELDIPFEAIRQLDLLK